jgi:hypothetical protein
LRFKFDLDSVTKSSGYYEIKPNADLSLQEKDIEHIHHYEFKRDKEILKVSMKPKK